MRLTGYAVLAALAAMAAWALGVGVPWSLVIGLVAAPVVVIAPRFLMAAVVGAASPGSREQGTDVMSGEEFEDHVARIARSCGAPVIMTPITGDWGVDIIVGKRPNRLAIQCKRQSRPVGAGAVQEVVAGAPMHGCTKTMVVTNHGFTPAAQRLAELHGCELVGGTELPRLRSTIRRMLEPSAPTGVS